MIKKEEIEVLEKGVRIDDYLSAPAKIKLLKQDEKRSYLQVTIHEGHNRQIRKMFDRIGYPVRKLHRIKEANIGLGDLKSGEYRLLKDEEVRKLKEYLDRPDH